MVLIKRFDDGFIARTAEKGDKQSVLDIKVYNGLDYVEQQYDHFMENPNIFCCLGELDGKVVAFGFCFLMDDGQAAYKGAGRSCESVRGKGYYRRFLKASDDYFHAMHPRVSLIKYVAAWGDFQSKAVDLLKRNGTLKTLVKRNRHSFQVGMTSVLPMVRTAKFQQLCAKYHSDEAKLSQRGIVTQQLLQTSNKSALFPENIVIVCARNFDILPSNLQYIMDISASHLTMHGNKQSVHAVSFITEITSAAGLRYDIEFYTANYLTTSRQRDLLIQHILAALIYLTEREYPATGVVHPIFRFPLSVDRTEIKQWILEHFPDWRDGMWTATQYIATTIHHVPAASHI